MPRGMLADKTGIARKFNAARYRTRWIPCRSTQFSIWN